MAVVVRLGCLDILGDEAADRANELQRQRAIGEFTQKMRDANYPALFERAATEFKVPPDILKAVSFAETRWTQLQWPDGETTSPENGMPRAYGIMSLWDNDYFGHALIEASKLIGQSPDVLKKDVFQNMRGGAALLRHLYDTNPKPTDASSENQIESWRNAIAKYTGIPQPELNQAHALRVYEFMNQGYHQYGIEWEGQKVNLEPMRRDVANLKALAKAGQGTISTNSPQIASNQITPKVSAPIIEHDNGVEPNGLQTNRFTQRKILLAFMAGLVLIAIIYRLKKNKR